MESTEHRKYRTDLAAEIKSKEDKTKRREILEEARAAKEYQEAEKWREARREKYFNPPDLTTRIADSLPEEQRRNLTPEQLKIITEFEASLDGPAIQAQMDRGENIEAIFSQALKVRESIDLNLEATARLLHFVLEQYDKNTAIEHSGEMAEMAEDFAKELGWSKEQQENFKTAVLLHDIGKVFIPREILNKPGKFTSEERNIMNTHPSRGLEVAREFGIPDEVADGVAYHHELYNGDGYPDGLAGEEIPPIARATSIIDVYNALVIKRPYKKTFTHEKAIGIMEENMNEDDKEKGPCYDQKMFDIFKKSFSR